MQYDAFLHDVLSKIHMSGALTLIIKISEI